MEDYAAKMRLKTDAELRQYVTGYVQYREGAVLAALDELRRRGQPAEEEAALRPALQLAADAQREQDAAAEAQRQEALRAADPELAAASSPSLYSPISIVLFSVPTLLIGGVLMCMNLYRVGRKRATLGLAVFMVAYAMLGSLLLGQLPINTVWSALFLNLSAALIYIFWFWPRYLRTTTFRSRSVFVPVLVCIAIMWGVRLLMPYIIQQYPKEVRQEMERMMHR